MRERRMTYEEMIERYGVKPLKPVVLEEGKK